MKKYLVMLPNNFGDVIMVLPVLEALKRNNQIHITFFVEKGFEDGILNSPYYDELYLFPRKTIKGELKSEFWQNGIEQIQQTVEQLNTLHFDVVVNLGQHAYCAFLTSLIKADTHLGRHFLPEGCHAVLDRWSQYLYAISFSRSCNHLHAIDVYKYIVGVNGAAVKGAITLTEDEKKNAVNYLNSTGWSDSISTVVIHPGAAYGSKIWPVDNYISLAKQLVDNGKWVIITGSPGEAELAMTIGCSVKYHCTVAAGKLTLRESIAVAAAADICVTGDTAMMHAASSLGKKVFALFGPTNPVETGPYGNCHIVFAGRCASRPCFSFDCETRQCMNSIKPETVLEMIINGDVSSSSCDIYKTSFADDGTCCLKAIIETGKPYSNKTASCITRKAFDTAFEGSVVNEADYSQFENECTIIIEMIESMERELGSFIRTRDVKHIQLFESLRSQLNNKSGIASFFTAVLNIGLNSVPVLNPMYAVNESKTACQKVRSLVSGGLLREV